MSKTIAPSREHDLAFLGGLAVASGNLRAAEGYLLELLANIAFGRGEYTTAELAEVARV